MAQKLNLRPIISDLNAVLRLREGHPLQPTTVIVSSCNAKDVAMLLYQSLCLQHVSFCARRSLVLMAVLAQTKSQAQP